MSLVRAPSLVQAHEFETLAAIEWLQQWQQQELQRTPIIKRQKQKVVFQLVQALRKALLELDEGAHKMFRQLGENQEVMNELLSEAQEANFFGLDWYWNRNEMSGIIANHFKTLSACDLWVQMKEKGERNQSGWQDLMSAVAVYHMLYKPGNNDEKDPNQTIALRMVDAENTANLANPTANTLKEPIMRSLLGLPFVVFPTCTPTCRDLS